MLRDVVLYEVRAVSQEMRVGAARTITGAFGRGLNGNAGAGWRQCEWDLPDVCSGSSAMVWAESGSEEYLSAGQKALGVRGCLFRGSQTRPDYGECLGLELHLYAR